MRKSDEKLYEEAEARVGFKRHLMIYFLINAFIWIFWYWTRASDGHYDGYWPAYTTLGWGIGVVSHFIGVYGTGSSAIEREFEKLKREQDRRNP